MRFLTVLLLCCSGCIFDTTGMSDDDHPGDPAAVLDGVGHLQDAAEDEDAAATLDASQPTSDAEVPRGSDASTASDAAEPAGDSGEADDASMNATDAAAAQDAMLPAPTPKAVCEPCDDTLECEEGLRCRSTMLGGTTRVCLPEIQADGTCSGFCEHLQAPDTSDGVCRLPPAELTMYDCRC